MYFNKTFCGKKRYLVSLPVFSLVSDPVNSVKVIIGDPDLPMD